MNTRGISRALGEGLLRQSAVRGELRRGSAGRPALALIPEARWLGVVPTDELEVLQAFLTFSNALGAGERHLGECTVLAWAQCHQAVALLDDGDARTVGRREGVTVKGTLALVADGIRAGTLNESSACRLIDDLVAVAYRLPCDGSSFSSWARDHDLLR